MNENTNETLAAAGRFLVISAYDATGEIPSHLAEIKVIEMSKNMGMGRAVDITDTSDERLSALLGMACTECGSEDDCSCFDCLPIDSGYADGPIHGYDY